MLESLLQYTVKAFKVTPREFAQEFPEPVLVIDAFAEGGRTFDTTTFDGAVAPHERSVAFIRKREAANVFGMMVTIGRARNNDVSIPSDHVSKFHAFIRFEPDGSARLTDAGSTYGTFVDERKLQSETEHASLEEGARIRLGKVGMTYFTPTGFHAFLTSDESD